MSQYTDEAKAIVKDLDSIVLRVYDLQKKLWSDSKRDAAKDLDVVISKLNSGTASLDDLAEVLREASRPRGRMLKETGERPIDRFVNYMTLVETETGLEFKRDLGQEDVLDDYKAETGREAEYVVARTDDDSWVTIGYSVGEDGDEDFFYKVEPKDGEAVYEEGITDWHIAAAKAYKAIKGLSKAE